MSSESSIHVGLRIRNARIELGMSQQVLANRISAIDNCKITRTALAQWESGSTKDIAAKNLIRAAKVLVVNPEWLLFGKEL